MQRLGFSLEEIKQLMGIRADKAHACAAVRQFLKTKLADVTMRIEELRELESELRADLRKLGVNHFGKTTGETPHYFFHGDRAESLRVSIEAFAPVSLPVHLR